jgi:GPN-loop GTPase
MIQFEIPHINILTKIDITKKRIKNKKFGDFIYPGNSIHTKNLKVNRNFLKHQDTSKLLNDLNKSTSNKYKELNKNIASILDQFGMVSFIPFDISDESSINFALENIDFTIQYGEDEEVKEDKDLSLENENYDFNDL